MFTCVTHLQQHHGNKLVLCYGNATCTSYSAQQYTVQHRISKGQKVFFHKMQCRNDFSNHTLIQCINDLSSHSLVKWIVAAIMCSVVLHCSTGSRGTHPVDGRLDHKVQVLAAAICQGRGYGRADFLIAAHGLEMSINCQCCTCLRLDGSSLVDWIPPHQLLPQCTPYIGSQA